MNQALNQLNNYNGIKVVIDTTKAEQFLDSIKDIGQITNDEYEVIKNILIRLIEVKPVHIMG